MAGEEQADDHAEQTEYVRLGGGAVEACGHGGVLLRSAGRDGPVGDGTEWAPTLGEPNEYLQVQHLAIA
ncbi:hypothetical protein GCM10023257_60420 [Streptomyces hyderabadensis]|uniref:Uncharacterized protein n=1 Tax=Streptomyces hyderabadensis TaxID=598549 RepID=A0ABP9IQJ3_9ACTN